MIKGLIKVLVTLLWIGALGNCKNRTKFSSLDLPQIPKWKTLTIQKEFKSSQIESAQITVDVEKHEIQQVLSFSRLTSRVSENLRQENRPILNQRMVQGHRGQDRLETFKQNATGLLDLLIVIDNSGSMKEEQENLASKMGALLQFISDSNWQIAVVTTDPDDPCPRKLIRKGDATATEDFYQAINAGLEGIGKEQGIRQAVTGLKCTNNTWVREKSTLAVLIVSDEDNCSNGHGCLGEEWSNPSYLLNYLQSIRNLGVDTRIYGIIEAPESPCENSFNPAPVYKQLIDATNGTWGSICAPDYTPTLQAISKDVAALLKHEFLLDQTPDPDTLIIKVDGQILAQNWTLVGQTVTFSNIPPKGALIEAQYSHGATQLFTSVPLNEVPAEDTLVIKLNGSILENNGYSTEGKTVYFKQQPLDNAEIELIYRKNTPLNRTFAITEPHHDKGIKVYIADKAAKFDYHEGIVTFKVPPPDGVMVTIFYNVDGEKILSYPFTPPYDDYSQIMVVDLAELQPVPVSIESNRLVFKEADFQMGKKMLIQYPKKTEPQHVHLPHAPISGSLKIRVDDQPCADEQVEQTNNTLVISCIETHTAKIEITYDYLVKKIRSFAVPETKKAIKSTWQVKINQMPTQDYQQKGSAIKFDHDLELLDLVQIEVEWKEDI